MVMTTRIGDDFVEWPSAPDDRTLGVVDFSIFPHLGHELMPENTMAAAERWAADIAGPAYAIDDQTAIKVTDGTVEVVSEGTGRYSPHSRGQQRSAWRSARSFYAAVSVRASGDADVCPPACTRLCGGPMASVRQFQVTFDCAEPERVAHFWCEVFGYVVPPPPEGFATWDDFDRALPPERQGSWFACIDPSGVGPRLFFQRVPEGKVVKNRLHLWRVSNGLSGRSDRSLVACRDPLAHAAASAPS
jgi:hypothetical protein